MTNKEYQRAYYQRNREATLSRRKAYREANKQRIREYCSEYTRRAGVKKNRREGAQRRRRAIARLLSTYKLDRPCACCGRVFPSCCMDFHHRDPETKLFSIGTAAGTRTIQVFMDEIAKCDFLCANCHRMVHMGRVTQRLAE